MADIADTDRNGGMGVDGAKDGGADCGDNTVESKQPTVAHFMEWLEDNKRVLRTFARGLAFGAAGTIVYVLYRAVKTTPGISQFKTATDIPNSYVEDTAALNVNILHCCSASGELYVEHVPFVKRFSKSGYEVHGNTVNAADTADAAGAAGAAADSGHASGMRKATMSDSAASTIAHRKGVPACTNDRTDGTGSPSSAAYPDNATPTPPAAMPGLTMAPLPLHSETNKPPALRLRIFGIVPPMSTAAQEWMQENLVGQRAVATMLHKATTVSAPNVVTASVRVRLRVGPWYTRIAKTNVAKRMCSEGLATTMLQTLPTDGSTASRKMMAEAAELGKLEETARKWGRGIWKDSAGRSAAAKALSAAGWLKKLMRRG